MHFTSFSIISKLFKQVLTRAVHVAASNRQVPFHANCQSRSSDLRWLRRLGDDLRESPVKQRTATALAQSLTVLAQSSTARFPRWSWKSGRRCMVHCGAR
jgi:hypothetical protein